ncbi:MAG: hypothetical protein R3C97_09800 [Geminicoccaceae bacterium]
MSEQAFEPGTPLDDIEAVDITRMIPHRYPFLLVDRLPKSRHSSGPSVSRASL